MKNCNEISPLMRNYNQFTLAVNKPHIIPGCGIDGRMVLYAPEYPTDIPCDAEHLLVSLSEQVVKYQRRGISGVYFGLESDRGKGYYVGKAAEDNGHVLVVGTNGSGKSVVIAKSTLETWRAPLVALDIKGELSEHYRRLAKKGRVERPYKVFDPANGGVHYNPYALLKVEDPAFPQFVREIADAIIPLPLDARDPYWIHMARHLLSGAIAYCFCNQMSFSETMSYIQAASTAELCQKIKSSSNLLARMFVSKISDLKPEHHAIIESEVVSHTMVFATDSLIQDALSDDKDSEMFSWDCLMDNEAPNIFLALSQDRLEQWSGVIRLMVTQLIRQLERRPDRFSDEKHEVPPLLILLDEFPMLGKMDIITSGLTTLRSKNVTFCLFLQSIAQLDAVYGSNVQRIMVDNCQYKAILNVTEPDSQEYFSKLFGSVLAENRSHSINLSLPMSVSLGQQAQVSRQPLILPEEFAINPNVLLHTPYGVFGAIKLHVSVTHGNIDSFNSTIRNYQVRVDNICWRYRK